VLTFDEARRIAVPGSLLLGVKRTSLIRALMSANDPRRSSLCGAVISKRRGEGPLSPRFAVLSGPSSLTILG
jgi:hypothetical protein